MFKIKSYYREEVGWVRSGIPSRQVIRKDYLSVVILTTENIGINQIKRNICLFIILIL